MCLFVGIRIELHFPLISPMAFFFISVFRSLADSFMLKTFEKGKYFQQRFYTLKLIRLAYHLCQSKIIVVLILILVELENLFSSAHCKGRSGIANGVESKGWGWGKGKCFYIAFYHQNNYFPNKSHLCPNR